MGADTTTETTGTEDTGSETETQSTGTGTAAGSETETTTSSTGTEGTTSEETGAGGKAAVLADLAKERRRRQELETELETLRKERLSAHELALEEAREAGIREATEKVLPNLFLQEVRALAGDLVTDLGRFKNPLAAMGTLDLEKIPTNADGTVDSAAVREAFDRLLESEPNLRKPVVNGNADQGSSGNGAQDDDLGGLSMEEYRRARGRTA